MVNPLNPYLQVSHNLLADRLNARNPLEVPAAKVADVRFPEHCGSGYKRQAKGSAMRLEWFIFSRQSWLDDTEAVIVFSGHSFFLASPQQMLDAAAAQRVSQLVRPAMFEANRTAEVTVYTRTHAISMAHQFRWCLHAAPVILFLLMVANADIEAELIGPTGLRTVHVLGVRNNDGQPKK